MIKKHCLERGIVEGEPEDRQPIVVRRKNIWKDVLHALSKPNVEEYSGIAVTFVGELPQDAGGPMKELFCLLLQDLNSNASIFCGQEDNRLPAHNMLALEQNQFGAVV